MSDKGEKCHDSRLCCLRGENGGCRALVQTYPDGECPFWKVHIGDIAGRRRKGRDDR